jgi:hypothetical protein
MMRLPSILIAMLAGLAAVTPANADAQRAAPSAASAFAIEAAGGTVGSIAGLTLGLAVARIDDCDSEDLACLLSGLSVGGVGGVIGATLGTVLVGRRFNTRPSTAGAIVGSLAGAAAGIGVVHLLTEEANMRLERVGSVLVFSVTQGLVTAIGSRIGASIRD